MNFRTVLLASSILIASNLGVNDSSAQYSKSRVLDSLLRRLDVEPEPTLQEYAKLHASIANKHPNNQIGLGHGRLALEYAQKANNAILEAEALEEISEIQRRLGFTQRSTKASLSALHIYDSMNLEDEKAAIIVQLASVYVIEDNLPLAIKWLRECTQVYDKIGDLLKSASVCINLGETYRLSGNLDSAQYFLLKALELNRSIDHKYVQGYALGNLGMVHAEQEKHELAIEEMAEAIAILEPLGDPYSVSVYEAEIGKVLIELGDKPAGEEKLLKAIETARLEGLKEQIRDFSQMLSDFYEIEGHYQKALAYQQEYQVYQDSLVNRENVRKIEQLRGQYELDKKESEIGFLNEQNNVQKRVAYSLGGGVSILLLLSFLLYRNNQQKRKANQKLSQQKAEITKREEEKALLLKELNHRVKNNLQMISSLLNLQSYELASHPAIEAIQAGKYRVEAMSLIHQKLYREDHHTQIPMKSYIEDLVRSLHYSFDQQVVLRFDIVDFSMDIDRAIPVALIINELVTNAFKYAYKNQKSGELSIIMGRNNDDKVRLVIADNGQGMNELEAQEGSFGLKLVDSLANQLDGRLEMQQSGGTQWILTFRL